MTLLGECGIEGSYKENVFLQEQLLFLKMCIAKGYQIVRVVKEVGSGVNDHRKLLLKLLEQTDYNLMVVEHKDRLSRVGFNYLKVLLNQTNRDIEVVNLAEERKDDLMQDFVSIITSFCARLYSLRRRNRKTECLIKCNND